jgi:hypothetical protein
MTQRFPQRSHSRTRIALDWTFTKYRQRCSQLPTCVSMSPVFASNMNARLPAREEMGNGRSTLAGSVRALRYESTRAPPRSPKPLGHAGPASSRPTALSCESAWRNARRTAPGSSPSTSAIPRTVRPPLWASSSAPRSTRPNDSNEARTAAASWDLPEDSCVWLSPTPMASCPRGVPPPSSVSVVATGSPREREPYNRLRRYPTLRVARPLECRL